MVHGAAYRIFEHADSHVAIPALLYLNGVQFAVNSGI
jgi:hypothetical protein